MSNAEFDGDFGITEPEDPKKESRGFIPEEDIDYKYIYWRLYELHKGIEQCIKEVVSENEKQILENGLIIGYISNISKLVNQTISIIKNKTTKELSDEDISRMYDINHGLKVDISSRNFTVHLTFTKGDRQEFKNPREVRRIKIKTLNAVKKYLNLQSVRYTTFIDEELYSKAYSEVGKVDVPPFSGYIFYAKI